MDFKDPLEPFKEIFFQLLAPKILLDADLRNQRLTYSYEGQTFGVESLSSGEREVLNISFDFMMRSPSHCIVFFDEPELHLHPELSYRLLTTLRSIGTRNQFILCTHSPDIISAALDQTVIFIAPQKDAAAPINQAIVVKEDDETNQALRLLGHSVGIVALGKKIVLVEGTNASLDKQTYGSLLKAKFPSLVLVPTGGKQTIQSFSSVVSSVLDKSLWGVEFFMLCDGDTTPLGTEDGEIEKKSKGRLRSLPQYHLENYFLDENVLAKVFENMEPADSWLRSPEKIQAELRSIAKTLVSYTVALAVSRTFRLAVGNVDIMPKQCHGVTVEELSRLLKDAVSKEKGRVVDSLDDGKVAKAVIQIYGELNGLLDANDNRWKARIPGKQLLAKFAAKANIDPVRLKTLYLHIAAQHEPNPFQEVFDIFASFDSLGCVS